MVRSAAGNPTPRPRNRCLHRAERGVQHAVVPAGVVGAADVHVRAVVGDDQPVALHRAENPCTPGRSRILPVHELFSRSRAPIGSAPLVEPAGCEAGTRTRWSRAPSRETRAESPPFRTPRRSGRGQEGSPAPPRRPKSSRRAGGRSVHVEERARAGVPLRCRRRTRCTSRRAAGCPITMEVAVAACAGRRCRARRPRPSAAWVIASAGIG